MIKKNPTGINRPTGRTPRLTPPARPGWYKRFKRLAALADKQFRLK